MLVERGYSPLTTKNYGIKVRLFFRNMKFIPYDVSKVDVREFIALRANEGKTNFPIQKYLFSVHLFFKFLVMKASFSMIQQKISGLLRLQGLFQDFRE